MLLARLPALLGAASSALVQALNPGGRSFAARPAPGVTTFAFGPVNPSGRRLVLGGPGHDGHPPRGRGPGDWVIPDVGPVALEALRLSAAGLSVVDPPGPAPRRRGPGLPATDDRGARRHRRRRGTVSSAIGLALDDSGDRSVQLRWGLDPDPPILAAVTQAATPGSPDTVDEDLAPAWLLALGGRAGRRHRRRRPRRPHRRPGSRACCAASSSPRRRPRTDPDVDPGFALDLLTPEALLARLERLLWNVATDCRAAVARPSTSPSPSRSPTSGTGDDRQLGLGLSLDRGSPLHRWPRATVKVELEVDASWLQPAVTPGLHGLRRPRRPHPGKPRDVRLQLRARRRRRRARRAVHQRSRPAARRSVRSASTASRCGSTARRSLRVSAAAPSSSSPGCPSRPAAPAGATRWPSRSSPTRGRRPRRPGRPSPRRWRCRSTPGTTTSRSTSGPVRRPARGGWSSSVSSARSTSSGSASTSTETDGTVTRITLLFDGRVAIFGLTAAVDQLSLTWLGGDVLRPQQLGGRPHGARRLGRPGRDLAGRRHAQDRRPPTATRSSYVGMLLGRFGIYGLSVFGGYTDDDGNPSFFVFGAHQRADRRAAGVLRHRHRRRAGHQPAAGHPRRPARFHEFPFIQALDPAATPPADPMAELRDAQRLLPAAARHLLVRRPASASPASPSSTASRWSRCPSATGWRSTCSAWPGWRCPGRRPRWCRSSSALLARFSTTRGRVHDPGGADRQLVAALRGRPAHRRLRVRHLVEGPAGRAVRAHASAATTPTSTATATPTCRGSGWSGRSPTTSSSRAASYFALTSEALMAGVDVEVSRRLRLGVGAGRVRRRRHRLLRPVLVRGAGATRRISAGIKIDTLASGTISFSITTRRARSTSGVPTSPASATFEVGPCSVTVAVRQRRRRRRDHARAGPSSSRSTSRTPATGTARALIGDHRPRHAARRPPAASGPRRPPTARSTRPFEVFAEFELTVTTSVPTTASTVGLPADATVPVVRSDGPSARARVSTPMRCRRPDLDARAAARSGSTRSPARWPTTRATWPSSPPTSRPAPRPEGSADRHATPSRSASGGRPTRADAAAPAAADRVTSSSPATGSRLVAEATMLGTAGPRSTTTGSRPARPPPAAAAGQWATRPTCSTARPPCPCRRADHGGRRRCRGRAAAVRRARHRLAAGRRPTARAAPWPGRRTPGRLSAPPLFGTLADGLASANADDVVRTRRPAGRPTSAAPAARARVSSATSPPAPASRGRGAGTSVADKRLQAPAGPDLGVGAGPARPPPAGPARRHLAARRRGREDRHPAVRSRAPARPARCARTPRAGPASTAVAGSPVSVAPRP